METSENNTTQMLKVVFEEMPWMAALAKLDNYALLRVNKVFEEATSFSTEELLGKSIKDIGVIIKPVDMNIMKDKVLENKNVQKFNVILRDKNEKMFKGTLSLCRVNFNRETCLLFVINDIVSPKRL